MLFNFLDKVQETRENDIKKAEEKDFSIENLQSDSIEEELAKKLDVIKEFSIDRIEENKVVLENRKDGTILQVEKERLPKNIKEGDILKEIKGKFLIDKVRTQEETDRIKNKMNDLWN